MPINSSIKALADQFSLKPFLQALAILVLMTLVSTRYSEAASVNLGDDELARLTRGEILQRDLPAMMACIRGLAVASGDNDQIEGDLKRCPGEVSEVSK